MEYFDNDHITVCSTVKTTTCTETQLSIEM